MSMLPKTSKRKAMEQDVDTDDLEERAMMQQPRTKFSEMEPANENGEGLEDEVPGSVQANTDTVKPADMLLPQQQTGDLNQITSHTHPQMADPTFAAAARGQHRAEAQTPGGPAATNIPSGAEEALQEPKELFNETGLPIEPFNLDKEREEGMFDASGGYIPTNFPQVKDAWLESIDDAGGVQGTDGDMSMDPPQAHPKNEDPVCAAPPELPAQDLKQYKQAVMSLLQPGETIPAALRRLSEGSNTPSRSSPSLEQKLERKLGGFGTDSGVNPAQNSGKAKQPRQQGHTTPAPQPPSHGDSTEFERLTEAAEVLLDHGHTDIYSWTREQVQQRLGQLDQQTQQPVPKRSKTQAAAEAEGPRRVDPQTFQASTAAELTYGKDKARQMLDLKRESGRAGDSSGLPQPQDVKGLDAGAVRAAGQSVDNSTQPSQPHQVKAGTASMPHKQQQAPTRPAPAINPVGASSNYTNKGLTSVNKSSAATQGSAVAAPSSSRAGSGAHTITGERVDQARYTAAKAAADEPPAESNTSQLDQPGLSGPKENALPGYQVEALGRAHGQKAGGQEQNKPQDTVGIPAEPGQGGLQGAPLGSAERPVHVVGATDLPQGTATEPSHQTAPPTSSSEDALYKQAATAFGVSPTADGKQ